MSISKRNPEGYYDPTAYKALTNIIHAEKRRCSTEKGDDSRMRMSTKEYRELENKNKNPSKYRNKKTVADGHTFDSKAEVIRYEELKMLAQVREIQGFGLQPSFMLDGGIRYRPDFIVCGKDGEVWVEDVKGFETKEFALKKRLWASKYPWLELRIVKC